MIKIISKIQAGLVCLMLMCCSCMTAAAQERPHRLEKAYEVLKQDHDEVQAIKLLREQLDDTPDNVECWMLLCRIYRNRKDASSALGCVNQAIKVNKPKKTGFFNSTLYWWKASVYEDMDNLQKETEWLEKALAAARKDNPKNVHSISHDLGGAYHELKRYDDEDAIYRQMLKDDEGDQPAMVGLARNLIVRGDYEGAVKMLDECQKYDEDYSSTYKFRSEAYDKMGQTDKAIDDAILWLDKDEDALTVSLVKVLLKHRTYAVAKAKSMMRSSSDKLVWKMLLMKISEESGEYEKAITYYDELEEEYGKSDFIYSHRADCYDALGLTDIALKEIDKAIEMDEDYYNLCTKGQILRRAGRYAEAIVCFDKAIEVDPTAAFAYYAKGWSLELSGDEKAALECYEQGIDIDRSYAYLILNRGLALQKIGANSQAKKDFEMVLQIDTTVRGGSCRHYALHQLGRDDEAEEWMQKIIDEEPYDSGNYYDKACLYSRMGRLDDAVKALETAFEMGYCKFAHIEHDDDMDAIRGREDFKALVAKYQEKLSERIAKMGKDITQPQEELITEVPITRRSGGTFNVDCNVNGLVLNMIFDTGASDVTISKVEADFMLKNNYLSKDDIKGKRVYQVADGGLSEGTVITLKEVKIGDAVLHNVDASVVKNQKAPLLLGESVLQKFGTFTVDNINSRLIIKH